MKPPSYDKRNHVKGLAVAVVVVAAVTAQFFIFATPHQHSHNLRASADTGCTVNAILVNSCRPWQGASPNSYPGVGSGLQARITDYETRTGSHVDVVHAYEKNAATLSTDEKYFINRPNTYALISYKPSDSVDWSQQDGSNATVNANIKGFADSIKSVAPQKVFVSIWHEPENDVSGGAAGCPGNYSYVGNKGTPAQYRAMWQNVRTSSTQKASPTPSGPW